MLASGTNLGPYEVLPQLGAVAKRFALGLAAQALEGALVMTLGHAC